MSPLRLSGTEVGYYRLKMSPWCMEWKAVELLKMRLLTRAGDWLSAVPGKTIYRELHCWSNETSRGGCWENWRLLAAGWSSSCSHWRKWEGGQEGKSFFLASNWQSPDIIGQREILKGSSPYMQSTQQGINLQPRDYELITGVPGNTYITRTLAYHLVQFPIFQQIDASAI